MSAELTLAIRRILSEPKILDISYSTDVPAAKGYASAKISTELVDAATTRIMREVQQEIAKARIYELERGKIKECTCDEISVADCDSLWHHRNKIDERIAELTLKEHKEKL